MNEFVTTSESRTVTAHEIFNTIKNNDEIMFEQSNIGQLLERLTSITKNDAADIKRNTPKSRINEMIDSIIVDLNSVSEEINRYCAAIEVNKQNLSERKDWMIETIRASLNTKILTIVGKAKAEVEKSGKPVQESELSDQINIALAETIQKVCVEEALSQNDALPELNIKLTGIGDMKMKQDRIPYEYMSVIQIPRDPSGLFEKAGSMFFHKQYYTSESRTETRYSTFDIGVNDHEIAQNIVLQLSEVFSKQVENYIDFLTRGYYEPIEKLQRVTINGIENTISNLTEMRM